MAPDQRDLEDTVVFPTRQLRPTVAGDADLDDTITVERGAGRTGPVSPPTAPVVTPPPSVPAADTAALAEFTGNVWSEPLPERQRPFLVRLADGTLVPLNRPVYLGRKPSVPRVHPGGTPLLVTLDSPLREVSSTHLELRAVGGAIVATDMKSTNGSVLRMPGSEPRTLLGGESAVVTPGTVIELGDGNLVELLAPDPDADVPASTGAPA